MMQNVATQITDSIKLSETWIVFLFVCFFVHFLAVLSQTSPRSIFFFLISWAKPAHVGSACALEAGETLSASHIRQRPAYYSQATACDKDGAFSIKAVTGHFLLAELWSIKSLSTFTSLLYL